MRGARGSKLIAAGGCLAVIALAAACGGHPQALVAKPGTREFLSQPASSPSGRNVSGKVAVAGKAGTYQVSEQQLTFAEPAHTGPAGRFHTTLRPQSLTNEISNH